MGLTLDPLQRMRVHGQSGNGRRVGPYADLVSPEKTYGSDTFELLDKGHVGGVGRVMAADMSTWCEGMRGPEAGSRHVRTWSGKAEWEGGEGSGRNAKQRFGHAWWPKWHHS